jgi:hypothetical protein
LALPNILATSKPGSQEIVLTIVGGTMLSLALTRPRLRWVDRLTETSPGIRLGVERGLTLLAFGIGGYAWVTLFVTLHGELEAGAVPLIRNAAYILIGYAALTHFEPFANGRTRSLMAACFAYVGWAFFAAGLGAAFALGVRVNSISAGWPIVRLASITAAGCFVIWWLFPKFEVAAGGMIALMFKDFGAPPEPQHVLADVNSQDAVSQAPTYLKILALPVTVSIVIRVVHQARRRRLTDDNR